MKKMRKGKFIVFEGIDGCGKSTQARILADRLVVLLTQEPYDSQISERVRKVLREESSPYSRAEELAGLFIEDRRIHVEEYILPRIKDGENVVSDRYDLSTIAYQATQGIDINDLIERHRGLLVPDVTFLVDTPVEVCMERTDRQEKKFEDDAQFQNKLRFNYLLAFAKLAKNKGRNITYVDGNRAIEDVARDIQSEIDFLDGKWPGQHNSDV